MEDIKMKKTYIAPKVDIYEVKVTSLLSGSPEVQTSGEADSGSFGDGANFSRGLIWEEEEVE